MSSVKPMVSVFVTVSKSKERLSSFRIQSTDIIVNELLAKRIRKEISRHCHASHIGNFSQKANVNIRKPGSDLCCGVFNDKPGLTIKKSICPQKILPYRARYISLPNFINCKTTQLIGKKDSIFPVSMCSVTKIILLRPLDNFRVSPAEHSWKVCNFWVNTLCMQRPFYDHIAPA
jgi:hypothetical protein